MSTSDNLQEAFAGESQANRKYLAFAIKAEKDGFPQVAKLFRAAAEAETVHAHAHLRVMGGIGSTAENLKAGIDGEGHEFKDMYPGFVAAARDEGNKPAEVTFRNAVEAGNDLDSAPIYICPVCGNTVIGGVPDTCEVCGVPGSRFVEVK